MTKKLCFIFFAAVMVSCGSHQEAPANSQMAQMYCDDILTPEELAEERDTSEYMLTRIENMELRDKCICLSYSYSGCRETQRVMTLDSKTMNESNRPEVHLKLITPKAGMCEMLLQDSSCFSLKELQLIGNEVLIKVNNQPEKLLISFKGEPTSAD